MYFFPSRSMWPLLRRDGQAIPYIALTLLWNRLVGHNPLLPNKQVFLRYLTLVSQIILFSSARISSN